MKLKIPPAIVFLICTILIVAIKKSMPAYQLTIPFNNLIGYGLFLSGVFIGLAGIIEFRKYKPLWILLTLKKQVW